MDHGRITDVVDRVLGSFVAKGQLRGDEVEDVRSTVMLRVLQHFHARDAGSEIRSIDDYVARMTINAANDALRARRSPADVDGTADEIADRSPEPQEAFATRQMLSLLWKAIGELPVMQRRGLLLHMHDENGGSAIPLLVFTGIATVEEIAAALEYTRATIESLWNQLPMRDLQIAELLGLTRPQVISLRRAARERLERARRRLLLPRSGPSRPTR